MIEVECDCGTTLQVADKDAGKIWLCTSCGKRLVVPGGEPAGPVLHVKWRGRGGVGTMVFGVLLFIGGAMSAIQPDNTVIHPYTIEELGSDVGAAAAMVCGAIFMAAGAIMWTLLETRNVIANEVDGLRCTIIGKRAESSIGTKRT